jgi:DNA-directed RNA polymerase I, II, and III subunit RPABC2
LKLRSNLLLKLKNNKMTDSEQSPTTPYLTKYEKARIIGTRAKQISMGSKAMIPVPKNMTSSHDIASAELRAGVIPIIIRRSLPSGPNGVSEYFDLKVSELKIKN